jgi:K+-sensing histidine kinase KdpD
LKEILVEAEPARTAIIQPIFDSIDTLEKIVVRLSFLTKASAHGAAKKPMDMGESVFRALQRMEGEISKKNASIVQPAFWPEVAGEAPWIETIWCNLVGNALKYGGERPRIELGWMRDEAEHKFWIRDSGVGVPPEKRSQLFQPFHLLYRTNSPKGLGLPLAQRLVELQGGRCGYAQWEEGGSDFFFTLPLGEESLRVVAQRVAR